MGHCGIGLDLVGATLISKLFFFPGKMSNIISLVMSFLLGLFLLFGTLIEY